MIRREATGSKKGAKDPVLLAGGNPQIPMGSGDAPVRAYLAAMPGWKGDVGRLLDRLIVRSVPGVQKAVKYNTPLYGIEEGEYFLSFHCYVKYVKVGFLRGGALHPLPPGKSKDRSVRYLDIREEDQLDEPQFVSWVKQASRMPGVKL